jgi:phosphoribosylglycinamide formyltransferase 1
MTDLRFSSIHNLISFFSLLQPSSAFFSLLQPFLFPSFSVPFLTICTMKALNLGIFVSGRGSNFRAICGAIDEGRLNAAVRLVVGSKPEVPALDFAREKGFPVYAETPGATDERLRAESLLEQLRSNGVDFVALCGYIKLIPAAVVQSYRNRIVNMHPALLPSFGGKGMYGTRVHQAVLDSGAKISGATVHLVDEEYDRGPIIFQKTVPVLDDDSPETLAARVLKIEHEIYSAALALFASELVEVRGHRTFIRNH